MVAAHVRHQRALVTECGGAQRARVLAPARVVVRDVAAQVACAREALAADGAHVAVHAAVHVLVPPNPQSRRERLAAIRTGERAVGPAATRPRAVRRAHGNRTDRSGG